MFFSQTLCGLDIAQKEESDEVKKKILSVTNINNSL